MEKWGAGCSGKDFEAINVRAKAVKGLVELVNGNLQSGTANNVLVLCLIVLLVLILLYIY